MKREKVVDKWWWKSSFCCLFEANRKVYLIGSWKRTKIKVEIEIASYTPINDGTGITANCFHSLMHHHSTGKSFKQRSGGKQFGSHHEEAVHHSKSSHTNPFDSRDSWKGW